MDWKKQTEKLIKVLNDAQRKMWDLCADSIKTIAAAPMDKKWVHSVEATEKVIANSLRTQAKLSAAIVDRLAEVDNMPKTTLESTRSIQEIIENLVVTQEKLLETWFDVLKREFVWNIGFKRNLTKANRLVRPSNRKCAVIERNISFGCFKHVSRDFLGFIDDLLSGTHNR